MNRLVHKCLQCACPYSKQTACNLKTVELKFLKFFFVKFFFVKSAFSSLIFFSLLSFTITLIANLSQLTFIFLPSIFNCMIFNDNHFN